MSAERKICCSIMLCQMTAILSGVSLLYLAVIVIIPSKDELDMNFNNIPIMCQTVKAEDLATSKQGKKLTCEWTTCGEWCLSKGSGTCMQVMVMPRSNGSEVVLRDCVDIFDKQCSALDVNITAPFRCKKGQCKSLTGIYNCTKGDLNDCREITAAYICSSQIDRKTISCTEDECEERLSGVYTCKNGLCNKLLNIQHYWRDCSRKCTDLKMQERNVVIFSKERYITTTCKGVTSNDNNTINEVNSDQDWIDKRKVLFIFCTYYKKENGKVGYDLYLRDCFNGTMGDASVVHNESNFLQILAYHRQLSDKEDWLVGPEYALQIMNITQLRINAEGCVNTLKKECNAFFETHAHDGRDGMTPDRYPCYFTNSSSDFVIGKFNPTKTRLILILASSVPGCLFIFSCTCLFICSKTVGVDDEGHLRVTLMQSGTTGGNTSEL